MDENDHYFTAAPASADERRRLRVRLAGRDVEVEVAPGIFSPGGLDKGTAVLLDEAPAPPPTGTFLDLGCGWGPLALTLGLLSPAATVHAVDVNERALDLARRNAAALGLEGVHASAADGIPDAVRFDLIWSNPPIRVGKEALHDAAAHLAAAPRAAAASRTSSCRRTSARTASSAGSRASSGCRAPAWRRAAASGCSRCVTPPGRPPSPSLPRAGTARPPRRRGRCRAPGRPWPPRSRRCSPGRCPSAVSPAPIGPVAMAGSACSLAPLRDESRGAASASPIGSPRS